jgi:hypothetical protein
MESGGFASAVWSYDGHEFATTHGQRNAMECGDTPVGDVDVVKNQH